MTVLNVRRCWVADVGLGAGVGEGLLFGGRGGGGLLGGPVD